MTAPALTWEAWAPPLDPPETGGLPKAAAEEIAAACWEDDQHLCAALMWEAYAAMLPPSGPAVSAVSTGTQTLTYNPAMPGGDFGTALARASWHRSMAGNLVSVRLRLARPPGHHHPLPVDWWQRLDWLDVPVEERRVE